MQGWNIHPSCSVLSTMMDGDSPEFQTEVYLKVLGTEQGLFAWLFYEEMRPSGPMCTFLGVSPIRHRASDFLANVHKRQAPS